MRDVIRVWLSLLCVIATSAALAQEAPTTQHAEGAIKVGWVVSLSTFEHDGGHGASGRFDSVTAIRKRFLDPQIELFALIEPGTEGNDDVVNVVRENFEADHVVNGADANELAKLDVIVCSRAWEVKPEVLAAIEKAVEGGVGLLRHLPLGVAGATDNDPVIEKLTCISEGEYYFERALTDCRVVSEHPLVAGLREKLENGQMQISAMNGIRGIVHGTPLIVLEEDVKALSNIDEQGKPRSDQGAKPPSDQKVFCPLFVGELGKGRVVACQWDSLPKPIVEATDGKFYIRCVQWLAKREMK